MKRILTHISLICSCISYGQVMIYGGGDNDGHSFSCHVQTSSTPVYGVFTGGNDNTNLISCYQENEPSNSSILFLGGTDNNQLLSNCLSQLPPSSTVLFKGGINDGTDFSCYTQIHTIEIFHGGIEDGFDVSCYNQDAVSPIFGVYTGGINDGADVSCFLQQDSFDEVLYLGGSDFSELISCHIQEIPPTFVNIFEGGSSSFQIVDCYQQVDYLAPIPLPIELLSFEANCTNNEVFLSWSTATEINSDYFLIEKSTNNIFWEEIVEIEAAGNSTNQINYSFIDGQPERSISYYRLKQYDFNGDFMYSPIKSVNCEGMNNEPELLAYPNPVNQKLNIQLTNIKSNDCVLKLFNINGQLIYSYDIQLENGAGTFEINRDYNMPSGIYFIKVVVIDPEPEQLNQKVIFQ